MGDISGLDVDPYTANFDVDYAAKHLTPNTRAIVPMHRMGLPCEMDKISDFAKKHGLILLEDAAHAQGASMQGKRMGTWGMIGMTSFQATKPLPGIEGGMAMYQTHEYFERASTFGHYEDPPKFAKDSPYRRYDGRVGPEVSHASDGGGSASAAQGIAGAERLHPAARPQHE
jgi:perosamine synthetase